MEYHLAHYDHRLSRNSSREKTSDEIIEQTVRLTEQSGRNYLFFKADIKKDAYEVYPKYLITLQESGIHKQDIANDFKSIIEEKRQNHNHNEFADLK